VQLLEEVESLKTSLDVAEGAVELQKEEVSRLRERNAELVRGEEESMSWWGGGGARVAR
jgi:hypothetical protein